MILVRPYRDDDLPALREIHAARKLLCYLPNPDEEDMLLSAVLENGRGRPELAVFLRPTVEAHLVIDPEIATRVERTKKFLMLNLEIEKAAKRLGIREVNCWVSPELRDTFGKLLLRLGWHRQLWDSYSKKAQ